MNNMIDSKSDGASRITHARSVPYFFAMFAALIYSVGFLVEFTFLHSMGVKDSFVDAFKARYIYTGILCAYFPGSILVAVLGMAKLKRVIETYERGHHGLLEAIMPVTVLFCIMLCFFYLLMAFARANALFQHQTSIMLFFVTSVVGSFSVRSLHDKLQDVPEETRASVPVLNGAARFVVFIRWALCVVSALLTIFTFRDIGSLLWEMLNGGGYLFFGFVGLAGLWGWRLDRRMEQYSGTRIQKSYFLISMSVFGGLLYLSVLFFALRVYCYIPAFKGGGDFTTEAPAIMRFGEDSIKVLDTNILAITTSPVSKPLYILHQSSESYFVALPNATNNPSTWRLLGRDNKPKTIFVLPKSAVRQISYDF